MPPINKLIIRQATDTDIATVQVIYAHHVTTGLGTFEDTPPSVEEMSRRRMRIVDRGLPFLVAEHDGAILGYAYAGPFRDRRAYRYSVEDSVFVSPEAMGQGIGSRLLESLIEHCTKLPCRQMVAMIGNSGNQGSVRLHTKHGFTLIGTLPSVGFKLGRWTDVVMMQRPLGDGDHTPPDEDSEA